MVESRILEKIRKCLALSGSSNEHEAAAAIRQAQALMRKHGLDCSDPHLFELKAESFHAPFDRPPTWAKMLSVTVADAFQCSLMTRNGEFLFVGKGAAPEVAAYCLSVLTRELKQAKQNFIATDPICKSDPMSKRKRGRAFSEGWIVGVATVVAEFSDPITSAERQAHMAYIKRITGQDDVPPKKIGKLATDKKSRSAAARGLLLGERVQIYQGMNGHAVDRLRRH